MCRKLIVLILVLGFCSSAAVATDPHPFDGALSVPNDVLLFWTPVWDIADVNGNHVYFGTSFADVSARGAGVDQGFTTDPWFDPGPLDYVTEYFWAVDSVNKATLWPGDVWSFTTSVDPSLLDPNLVGQWRLEGNLLDSTVYWNDGTAVGGPLEYIPGARTADEPGGLALALNGIDQGFDVDHDASLKPATMTIAVWIRVREWTWGWQCVVRKSDGSAGRYLLAYGDEGGGDAIWAGYVIDAPDGTQSYWEIGAPVDPTYMTDGRWHHVATTYDGEFIKIYLDGELCGYPTEATGTLSQIGPNPVRIGQYNGNEFVIGDIDDVRIYNRALSDREIAELRGPVLKASMPRPRDGERTVSIYTDLRWLPGCESSGVGGNHVYLSTDFAQVDTRDKKADMGLTTDPCFVPGTPLEYLTEYFWAIDSVNEPSVWPGNVWSFTTEPDSNLVPDPNLVLWLKLEGSVRIKGEDYAPDSSGYGHHGLEVNEPTYTGGIMGQAIELDSNVPDVNQWLDVAHTPLLKPKYVSICAWVKTERLTGEGDPVLGSVWQTILRKEDNPYNRMWLHIGNGDSIEFGVATSDGYDTVTATVDPATFVGKWHHIAAVFDGENQIIYVDAAEEASMPRGGFIGQGGAESVTIGAGLDSGYDQPGTLKMTQFFDGLIDDLRVYDYGLSQVEIKQIMRGDPTLAWNPNPANGSTPYIRDATPLSWSPGDNASQHDVYFGTDKDAVANADESDTSGIYRGRQGAINYTPPEGVEWGGGPYYWRIDEYNTDATISKGYVWSFTVTDFLLVDDFESYNDLNPDDPESNRIFHMWLDGLDNPAINGSIVGYANPPFAEQTIVHSGSQSMPLFYDNSVGYSEATMTLTNQRDWTDEGVGVLTIWFRGEAANTAEPLSVALNGNAIVTHENPDAAQLGTWTEWTIDLQVFADQGVNLTSVNTISLGLGNKSNPLAGGTGVMYIDDIRLYRPAP